MEIYRERFGLTTLLLALAGTAFGAGMLLWFLLNPEDMFYTVTAVTLLVMAGFLLAILHGWLQDFKAWRRERLTARIEELEADLCRADYERERLFVLALQKTYDVKEDE